MANTLKFGNGQWATGNGTALAYNDENANFKPLPFDFTRASSGTTVNQSGLIETVGSGIPRIDFQGNTKGALKLEPSRTNLITYSSDFSNAYWTKSASSVVSGFVSPDGGLNAFKLVEDSTLNNHRIAVLGLTGSGTHTISVFGKANDRNWLLIRNVGNNAWFDVSNGVVGTVQSGVGSIENYGNGWYKCSLTMSSLSSPAIGIADNNGSYSYQGNGTGSIYIWGAQVEVGSYPTSYIPTSGSAVTRVVETCSQTVAENAIGQTEGTMYAEINIPSITSVGTYSGFNIFNFASPSANKISIDFYNTGRVQATSFSGGSIVVNIDITNYGLTSGIHKFAFAYKLNDYILYIDGSIVGSDTSATVPSTNHLDLYDTSGTNSGSLNHNDVKLYNTRLSNAELAALTTI